MKNDDGKESGNKVGFKALMKSNGDQYLMTGNVPLAIRVDHLKQMEESIAAEATKVLTTGTATIMVAGPDGQLVPGPKIGVTILEK